MKRIVSILLILYSLILFTACSNTDRDVSISLPSGTYYGEQKVTLSCADPSAQITYTLDSSDPGQSRLIYDPEKGLTISFSSELKATAGENVATANYEIIPYPETKDAAQRNFIKKIEDVYSTDVSHNDNFIIDNEDVTIQQTGSPEIVSKYLLTDVTTNSATITYTGYPAGNVTATLVYDPYNYTLTVNDKTYTALWYLEELAEEDDDDYY